MARRRGLRAARVRARGLEPGADAARSRPLSRASAAASLWAVAAVGLAVGGGLYAAAITATVLVLVILAGLKPIERRVKARHFGRRIVIEFARDALRMAELHAAIETAGLHVKSIGIEHGEAASDVATVQLERSDHSAWPMLLDRLRVLPGVEMVRLEGPAG